MNSPSFTVPGQLYYILFLVMLFSNYAMSIKRGQCDLCLSNGVACLDETHFAPCVDGIPTTPINRIRCPEAKVCTEHIQICSIPIIGNEAVCYEDYCGTCEFTNGRFACMGEDSYAFCYGSMLPDLTTIRRCPADYVCDYNSPQICGKRQTSTPSCTPRNSNPTTTEITTVTATPSTTEPIFTTRRTTSSGAPPIEDPDTFCIRMQQQGYFTAPGDETCKAYIYCYLLAGQHLGIRYTCSKYFNSATGNCQNYKPKNC